MFKPVIKWSGSKRSQSQEIVKRFPNKINTYYEPFIGGASVLRQLISSDIDVTHYICSDINNDLIDLWNNVKYKPKLVADYYEKLWNELNIDDDLERKKEYFYMVRDRFNKEKNPLDFMFIMRTAINGMPRYNKKGGFNTSFHITRKGINPKTLRSIINDWSEILNKKDVQFLCQDYSAISGSCNDLIYCDPPYANTKGIYYGVINYNKLWDWLRQQKCFYLLSFDGKTNNSDFTYNIPNDIYDYHEYLYCGNSSFRRLNGKSNETVVSESLYIKRGV
jgi:DNA adenine methylase